MNLVNLCSCGDRRGWARGSMVLALCQSLSSSFFFSLSLSLSLSPSLSLSLSLALSLSLRRKVQYSQTKSNVFGLGLIIEH